MNPPNSTVKLRGVGTASNLIPVPKNNKAHVFTLEEA